MSTIIPHKIFNYAQNIVIDPSAVKNSSEVGVSGINLYFRAIPQGVNNKSGINYPGVEVSIVKCNNGIPSITSSVSNNAIEVSRVEYGEIQASTDSSLSTLFKFNTPVKIQTDTEYAFMIKFDGNEDFVLWDNTKGEKLVSANNVTSPGINNSNIGKLFKYIGPLTLTTSDTSTSSNSSNMSTSDTTSIEELQDEEYFNSNWKAVADTVLKFDVFVARFSHSGVPVSTNTSILSDQTIQGSDSIYTLNNTISVNNGIITLTSQSSRDEYIIFDQKTSNINAFSYGEAVYQSAPYYPGGVANPLTISVIQRSSSSLEDYITANGNYILANGVTFNNSGGFNNIFGQSNEEYIVITSGMDVNVRKVSSVISNTVIKIDDLPITITNSAAYFFKSPVGYIGTISDTLMFSSTEPLLSLYNSNANGSVRFVNNSIEQITVSNAGVGYSNSFYLKIGGYEDINYSVKGGYFAYANIVTNNTGGIVSVYTSNNGCGFTNTTYLTGSNIQVLNSVAGVVTGSIANGAVLNYIVGSTLKTEINKNSLTKCRIVNLETSRIFPSIDINNPLGSTYSITHRSLFTSQTNPYTVSGKEYHINDTPENSDVIIKPYETSSVSDINVNTVKPSRSNQYIITYANGQYGNSSVLGVNASNASVLLFNISSNNDFSAPFFDPQTLTAYYYSYVINNDYTNENTNYGNAISKHITTKITLEDTVAEDIIVELTAYRPIGTDIKVFVRIHNSSDPETFDEKDWTLLECINNSNVYSSQTNESDFVEYSYNFYGSPNTYSTLVGSATLTLSNNTITGVGTTFTTDIANNDLIKIYSPLFKDNYMVSVVNNVVNNTTLNITTAISNSSMVGTGFKIDKLQYINQAFNNVLSDNVVRYYNTSKTEFDGYDTAQLKLVYLSNNSYIVPRVDDIRVSLVSP